MSNFVYTQGTGAASTDVFVTKLSEGNPSPSDINYPIGKRWVNVQTGGEFILVGQTSFNGQILANWVSLGNGNINIPLTVPQGGTGRIDFSPYSVICSGINDISPLTTVSTPGEDGQVLTSQGPSAYPIWKNASATTFGHQTTIITEDTVYIPSTTLTYIEVICIGAGGGGGGAGTNSVGGGGGSGGFASRIFTRDEIISQEVIITIGQGGTGGSAGQPGGAGTLTGFGSLITANGGQGGLSTSGTGNFTVAQGGTPGNATGGDINLDGQQGFPGFIAGSGASDGFAISGSGGSTFLGFGAPSITLSSSSSFSAGVNATSYGAGGSGAAAGSQGQIANGGNGANGVIIINSYVI